MSLKDKLKQRAQTGQRLTDAAMQDLPLAFRQDLMEFNRRERLNTVFSGIHKDQFVQVSLAPGNGNAFLSIFFRNDGFLKLQDIELILSNVGVVHGLLLNNLSPYYTGDLIRKPFKKLNIAKGTSVTPGKSGHIELLKRPYNSSVNPDLESFDQVAPEDEIAVVHPPIRGIPGMTVLGEEIPPPAIQMEDYRINSNINTVTTEDRTVLIATTYGYLSHYNEEISVIQELKLDNDITCHRGNLVFSSNVNVQANICEKVSMNIGGNLFVMGMISEAQIHVEKDLIIDKGVFGKGESTLSIGGELRCRYLNEVSVDCEGDIRVDKEIFNSHVWTRSQLQASRAVIVGGNLFAHDGLEVNAIGSELGLKSLVVVGLDKREYRIKHELMPQIEELRERLAQAEEVLPTAPPQNKESLEARISDLKGEIQAREGEIEYFKERMKPQNPEAIIHINHAIYPGTVIMIAERDFSVKEKMEGPINISLDGENFRFDKAQKT